MSAPDRPCRVIGASLVVLQFVFLGSLGFGAWAAFGTRAVPSVTWTLGIGGVALALWAVACNRPGNFNIRPEPRAGGQLVVHGPYRWIRHPMYTAVIALGAACAALVDAAWAWLCVAALVAVLVGKATLEERALLVVHPDYGAYRARTKRFLPWVV